jgi:PAS domain S-box-containing protein
MERESGSFRLAIKPIKSPADHARRADIAQHRLETEQAEFNLRLNASLFYALMEQAPIGVYVVDDQFRLNQVNAYAQPAFAKVEAPIGRDFTEVMQILWGMELGGQVAALFRHTLATGERYVAPRFSEHRYDLDENKAYEWEIQRVTLPSGRHGVVCYFRDITERVQAEEALRHSEALYRTIGESINYGVWVCAPDGRNTYASESFLKLVGLTQAECSNFGWEQLLHPDDRERTITAWLECVRTGGNWDMEHRFRGVDGQWHHILARGLPVKDSRGKIISWAGINLDISRLKQALQALRESDERTRLATEATGVGVWEWNVKTGLLRWDAHIFHIYGIPPTPGGVVTYDTWRACVLPEDLPRQEELLQGLIRTGGHSSREFRIRRPGETECRHIQAAETVRRDAQGEVEWVVGTNLDITERHRSETALREAKAAAESANRTKDQFLAALSHELRTPLMPVLITAESLREDPALPPAIREQFSMIERNISLEVQLLGDLLDITAVAHGKLQMRQELFDAHTLIGLAVEIVQDEAAAKGIHIQRDLAARHGGLTADPSRFQQVIWNLLRNAVKFTPSSGLVKIRTLETQNGRGELQLRVEVSDTGIGIEPALLQKIFEPFEQAAATGIPRFGGMGLGLAIARAIVDLHGGRIWAESDGVGCGSTFMVEFPGATLPPPPMSETAKDSPGDGISTSSGGKTETSRRLLLVEDHLPTRQIIASLLTRSGYQIVTASTVAEALAEAAAGTFDLVISDLGLPDGTGIQLMEQLRAQHGLRGIALSGYGMEEDIARARQAGFIAHLIKPVRMADLRKVLALY